jgi:hypothetical protein
MSVCNDSEECSLIPEFSWGNIVRLTYQPVMTSGIIKAANTFAIYAILNWLYECFIESCSYEFAELFQEKSVRAIIIVGKLWTELAALNFLDI